MCTWLARHAATAALEVDSRASFSSAAFSASLAAVSVASAAVLAACASDPHPQPDCMREHCPIPLPADCSEVHTALMSQTCGNRPAASDCWANSCKSEAARQESFGAEVLQPARPCCASRMAED